MGPPGATAMQRHEQHYQAHQAHLAQAQQLARNRLQQQGGYHRASMGQYFPDNSGGDARPIYAPDNAVIAGSANRKGGVYDRLANPKNFSGVYAARFDGSGDGRINGDTQMTMRRTKYT